jgi:multiple sugar transport system substrate-binding protein
MKKKVISALFGALAVALLSACGATGGGSSPTETPQASSEAGTEAATVEGSSLSFWHWDINMQEQYELIFAEFYEQTGILVEQSITPWGDYWTNLATALPAGAASDIFWLNHPNAVTYVPSGLILDLTDFNLDMSGFVPALYEPFVSEGRLYGVAVFFDTIALFYNKDLFDEAGVPYPPHRGWTWDEFRDAARQLTQVEGNEVMVYGAAFTASLQSGSSNFIRQNGGEFLSDDRTRFHFDSPEILEALRYWHDMIWVDGVALNPAEPGWGNFFLNGMSAMEINGMWRVSTNYEYLEDRLGVAHLPMRSREANTFHSVAHVASASTQNPEGVRLFMELSTTNTLGDYFAPVFLPTHDDSQQLWMDRFPALNLNVFTEAAEIARPLAVPYMNAGAVWTFGEQEMSRLFSVADEITMEALTEITNNMNEMIHQ